MLLYKKLLLMTFGTTLVYSECVSVTLVIQHATRMRRIVVYDLCGCTIFFHIISYTARFSGGKSYWRENVFLICFLQRLSEIFLILRRIQRDTIVLFTGLYVKYPLFLSDGNET